VRGLRKEIKKARELSPGGILGVNLMVAINNYKDMVLAAVEEKIDLIISGAGLPTELPALVKGSETKIAPIVSSGKAAALISKLWDRKFSYIPDMVIVEGPEAGGHLGFSVEQLKEDSKQELSRILNDVIEALKPFQEKYKKIIPVIAAGGIFSGIDIAKYLKLGAAGVQMATRFVGTEECDADVKFKEAYIQSHQEEIQIVQSPLGMPGRAIRNEFIKRLEVASIPIKKCYRCLKPCKPDSSPYCICEALVAAVNGNIEDGLVFAGSNAYQIDKIVTVKQLMQQLVKEAETAMD
jgi:nitronate monooxygenase